MTYGCYFMLDDAPATNRLDDSLVVELSPGQYNGLNCNSLSQHLVFIPLAWSKS